MRRPSRSLSLILLLLICAGLVFWQNRAQQRGNLSTPATGALWVLRPVQRTFSAVASWFTDMGRTMFRRGDIISENRRLQDELAGLKDASGMLQRYKQENDELRRMLSIPKPAGGKVIAADIVSLDATDYARRAVLNVGSRQGVRDKDVVYTAQGVVGQVVAEGPVAAAVVQLLTDRKSGVGAINARTMAKGVVLGTGGRTCEMKYLDFQADVREGDLVLTSGMAISNMSFFPKGLVIGRVLKVERDKTYSRTTATIDPAVPFDQISTVLVRTGANR